MELMMMVAKEDHGMLVVVMYQRIQPDSTALRNVTGTVLTAMIVVVKNANDATGAHVSMMLNSPSKL